VLTGVRLACHLRSSCIGGLVGNKIEFPLFPFVAGEFTYHGSFWPSKRICRDTLVGLAQQGKDSAFYKAIWFEDINANLEIVRRGDNWRAVCIRRAGEFLDVKEAKTRPHRGEAPAKQAFGDPG